MSREVVKIVEKFDADQIAKDHIKATETDESFFIVDVGDVVKKYQLWYALMPRIQPDYAFKCNNHVTVAGTLAMLGAGNDCASSGEIEKVLSMGVPPSKIVFAQTVKPVSHIKFAKNVGVHMMTFDNEEELYKIAKHFPEAEFDPKSVLKISFGEKFGCMPGKHSEFLLRKARELKLNVKGIAFHIGIGCLEYEIFGKAIADSAQAFKYGKSLGHRMDLLDIGGGFPGREIETITGVSKVINESLQKHFPDVNDVKVISEPGTFFCEKAFKLYANVHSKNVKINEKGEEIVHYYITDGIYQSFNAAATHSMEIQVRPLKTYEDKKLRKSVIWGRACDPNDIVIDEVFLPDMACGDWVVFDDSGAYRLSTTTTFNGFPNHMIYSFIEKSDWETLKKMKLSCIDFLFDVEKSDEKK